MKVLVADDEPVTCRLLQWFLERWGMEPVIVNDGSLAEWMLMREDAPRLALLDWMMPGVDGVRSAAACGNATPDPTSIRFW